MFLCLGAVDFGDFDLDSETGKRALEQLYSSILNYKDLSGHNRQSRSGLDIDGFEYENAFEEKLKTVLRINRGN
jgi:hypothetical protein